MYDLSAHLRLSLSFSPVDGKFHHYQVWQISKQTGFMLHVADLVPGTTQQQADAFLDEIAQIAAA